MSNLSTQRKKEGQQGEEARGERGSKIGRSLYITKGEISERVEAKSSGVEVSWQPRAETGRTRTQQEHEKTEKILTVIEMIKEIGDGRKATRTRFRREKKGQEAEEHLGIVALGRGGAVERI